MLRTGTYHCCGSEMSILDPGSVFFPSRIRIKDFKCFNPKKMFLSSRKYDPSRSSRIRILIFFYPSRIQGSKRHRIPNPQHWYLRRHKIFKGDNCECETDAFETEDALQEACRPPPVAGESSSPPLCNGFGKCRCGKCTCSDPPHFGPLCECLRADCANCSSVTGKRGRQNSFTA